MSSFAREGEKIGKKAKFFREIFWLIKSNQKGGFSFSIEISRNQTEFDQLGPFSKRKVLALKQDLNVWLF